MNAMPTKKLIDLNLNVEIGRRLRSLRKRRKMTLMDVADRLYVSWQQIQKYEVGIDQVSIAGIRKFAQIYGVSPCEICGCNNA